MLPTLSHTRIRPSHDIPTTNRPLFTITQCRRPHPQLVHRDVRLRQLPFHTTALKDFNLGTITLHHASFQHHSAAARHNSSRVVHSVAGLALLQNAKAETDFGDGDDDGNNDEHDDDPGDGRHLGVGDGVGEDLCKVQEDAAALVEDLDSWVDLEVVANCGVERSQGRFGFPEEVGYGKDVGGLETLVYKTF